MSATKSAMETSVSCPTAEIIGILDSKIAFATISSLNAHRSSKEPPPLPIIMTSARLCLLKSSMAFAISKAAPSPWTLTGFNIR
ncbi:MAG: hypothetical protein ACD_7C00417G0001 [uncultured bacterium]|nr:MAG: hypothetical protein ACD_7C00417G0001 [uncultured bacterium]